jgi:hypothetical protein
MSGTFRVHSQTTLRLQRHSTPTRTPTYKFQILQLCKKNLGMFGFLAGSADPADILAYL